MTDIGGQVASHPLAMPVIFKAAKVMVVCVDLTDIDSQKQYIGDMCTRVNRDVPILLVGTKKDMLDEALVSQATDELARLSEQVGAKQTIVVSSTTKENIDDLKTQISRMVKAVASHKQGVSDLFENFDTKLSAISHKYPMSSPISSAASKLRRELASIKTDYIKAETYSAGRIMTLDDLKSRCKTAVDDARTEFEKHRGWHKLDSTLRGFLGVLATLTIIPAVLVGVGAKKGYVDTFFKTPKTTSVTELEAFQKAVEDIPAETPKKGG